MAHGLAPCSAAILAREAARSHWSPPPSLKLHIPHPSALILSLCQDHRRTFSFSSTGGTREHLWFKKKKCEYSSVISYFLSPKSRARGKCMVAVRAELLSSNGCSGFKMPAEGRQFLYASSKLITSRYTEGWRTLWLVYEFLNIWSLYRF